MTEFEKRMKSKLESMRASILSKIKTSTSIPQEERSDIIDLTAVEKLRDVESIVTSIDTDILKLIERALDKIQSGTYGYCEICGIKIDRERLEEVPYVRYCIDCQEKVELEERVSRVEEETLASAPVRVSLDDSSADLEEVEEEEEEKPAEAKGEEGEEGEGEKEEEEVESELKDIEISEELDKELEEEIEEEVEKEIGEYEEESEGEEEEQEPVARRKREKKIAKKHYEGKLKVGGKRLAQKQTSKMEKEKKEEKKKEIKAKEKKVKAKALKTKKTEEKGSSKAKRKSKK
jgi:RNA polymerase-binding protein DksA